MSMETELNESEQAWLDAFDRALADVVRERPVDARIAERVQAAIRRQHLLRLLLPLAAVLVAGVLVAPALWSLASAIGGAVTVGFANSSGIDAGSIYGAAARVPVYLWALIAASGVAGACMIAER